MFAATSLCRQFEGRQRRGARSERLVQRLSASAATLGQLQLRIVKDAGSHLRHRVEQAARLQRLAVLRL